jgi:hypothetical protein
MPTDQSEALLDSLKKVTAILREAGISFALGGGMAAWARGGPPTEHDIDLVIRESDTERALDECAAAGLRTAVPPEGWLVKVWDGDTLVDLIFRPTGLDIDDAFANAEMLNVHAAAMPVLSVDDLLTTKLLALTEHHLDYAPVLEYARSLREQIDWRALRDRTEGSPFARAFFTLVEALGVCTWESARTAGAAEAHMAASDAATLTVAPAIAESSGA